MRASSSCCSVRFSALAGALLSACVLASPSGCGASGRDPLGEVGTYDGAPSFSGGDASAAGALDAHIEENHVSVTFVALRCSGDCADVEAVASGGRPPYTFAWDDGSTNPARRVCPSSTTAYHLTVSDTGTTGELAQGPEMLQVSLTADVLACPDGGTADAGQEGFDASPGGLCLQNTSFENSQPMTIHLRNSGAGPFDAPPWLACDPNPDISGADTYAEGPSPSDGLTFLNELSSSGVDESAGQNLCGTWSAGRAAHLLIDLTSEGPSGCTLQFFGSSTPAGAACPSALELLGESSPIASGGAMTYAAWSTQCVTLTPQFDTAFLELKPRANCGAFLAIDNIRQVASCP